MKSIPILHLLTRLSSLPVLLFLQSPLPLDLTSGWLLLPSISHQLPLFLSQKAGVLVAYLGHSFLRTLKSFYNPKPMPVLSKTEPLGHHNKLLSVFTLVEGSATESSVMVHIMTLSFYLPLPLSEFPKHSPRFSTSTSSNFQRISPPTSLRKLRPLDVKHSFLPSSVHLANKYFSNTCYMPSTMLGTRE